MPLKAKISAALLRSDVAQMLNRKYRLLDVLAAVVLPLLALVLFNAILYLGNQYYSRTPGTGSAFGEMEWASQYLDELEQSGRAEWKPYTYWRRRPFRGKFINIGNNGERITWPAPRKMCGDRSPRVIMFGGSAMWGTGARDAETIPSLVARRLYEKGFHDVCLVNAGESGYVSTQNLILYLDHLREGAPRVAVFYEGPNDIFSAYQNKSAGIPQNEENRIREFNLSSSQRRLIQALVQNLSLYKFILNISRVRARAGDRSLLLAKEIAEVYWTNLRLVETLSRAHGVEPLFYLQPILYDRTVLRADEEKISRTSENILPSKFYVHARQTILMSARKDSPKLIDAASYISDYPEALAFDLFHINERGNRLIADRIADDVAGRLRRNGRGLLRR